MSLSFELPVGPSRVVHAATAWAHLCGLAGAALLGLDLHHAGRSWAGVAVACVALLATALSWSRSVRRLAAGRLAVDDDGAAQWQAQPARGAIPFEPLRWHTIGPLAWIDGASGDRRVRLLLGRDRAGDADWRRLQAWLRWMDRGGRRRMDLESAGAAPISST